MVGSASDDTLSAGAVAHPPVGAASGVTLAGRYELGRELGRGAMGQVYAAFDRELGDQVAVKVIAVADEKTLERVRREVRLARRVTHRNAARTFDLGQSAGVHFITMELVQGTSLAARLKDGPVDVALACDVGRQICQGLAAAHEVGVVHRDLKPANVMVGASGRVVLTDFGVARAFTEQDAAPGRDTQVGAVVGTPAYMAPEQILGEDVGPAADLFAVGVMLFEMVTGALPFPGATVMAQLIGRLEYELPAEQLEPFPPDLARWVARCLERDPARRPADAADVAAGLARVVSSQGGETLGSRPSSERWFSAIPSASQTIAVLPFRHRGQQDDAYLADALSEELVDLLSMTRGLRVLGVGATAKFAETRDAQRVGEVLEVEHVVDGSIDRQGNELRITTRLVDAKTGVQRWRHRFVGPLSDIFDLQDRIAKRVAEFLRLELHLLRARERAPQAAVELYLRARAMAQDLRTSPATADLSIKLIDQCLAIAPDLAPAIAFRAEAYLRRWSLPGLQSGPEFEDVIARMVASALSLAPGQPDTYVTAARYAVTQGEFARGARHLATALTIAPTSAAAHGYLGFLQCDAGRSEEGVRHILLAKELDPSLAGNMVTVLRALALAGDFAAFDAMLSETQKGPNGGDPLLSILEMRIATWRGDMDRVRAIPKYVPIDASDNTAALLEIVRNAVLFPGDLGDAENFLSQPAAHPGNPRVTATMHQVAAELSVHAGNLDRGLWHIERADEHELLIDADWFDRCPVLDPLRQHPRFLEISAQVRRRAEAIWQLGPAD